MMSFYYLMMQRKTPDDELSAREPGTESLLHRVAAVTLASLSLPSPPASELR